MMGFPRLKGPDRRALARIAVKAALAAMRTNPRAYTNPLAYASEVLVGAVHDGVQPVQLVAEIAAQSGGSLTLQRPAGHSGGPFAATETVTAALAAMRADDPGEANQLLAHAVHAGVEPYELVAEIVAQTGGVL